MSELGAYAEALVAGLNHRVVEAEMRSMTAADALSALMRADLDTAEAERCLNEAMDTLLVLRRQLTAFPLPDESSDRPPAAP